VSGWGFQEPRLSPSRPCWGKEGAARIGHSFKRAALSSSGGVLFWLVFSMGCRIFHLFSLRPPSVLASLS
jgi:hypothetical protein